MGTEEHSIDQVKQRQKCLVHQGRTVLLSKVEVENNSSRKRPTWVLAKQQEACSPSHLRWYSRKWRWIPALGSVNWSQAVLIGLWLRPRPINTALCSHECLSGLKRSWEGSVLYITPKMQLMLFYGGVWIINGSPMLSYILVLNHSIQPVILSIARCCRPRNCRSGIGSCWLRLWLLLLLNLGQHANSKSRESFRIDSSCHHKWGQCGTPQII